MTVKRVNVCFFFFFLSGVVRVLRMPGHILLSLMKLDHYMVKFIRAEKMPKEPCSVVWT